MMLNKLSTIFDITDFGAVPNGEAICTDAFNKAVIACTKSGGGTIFVPSGTFITGPVQLESNITLYLDSGAILKFSRNLEDYPVILTRWEGSEQLSYMPMLYGKDVENVIITGYGLLDGQGEYWWKPFKEGVLKYPRPRFISIENGKRIIIENIRLINSPSWTINPIMCDNVTIDKITIKNPSDSPNTDGINPDSSSNIHISNCHVDVGDDCITIKSGIEKSSFRVPCENITVSNCTLINGHGGVVIGSEMSGGVRNVVISNCVFMGTDRGIRMKTRRGRGGIVEDIRVNNLVMRDVMCPIVIHQYYFCGDGGKEKIVWDKAAYPVTEATPVFRDLHFSNISAVNAHAAAAFIYGLTEMPVENITFNNVSVLMAENAVPGIPAMMSGISEVAKMGFYLCNVKNATFNGVTIKGHTGEAIQMENCEKAEFSSCNF